MKKLTHILSGILAVQIVLAILLFGLKPNTGAYQSNQSLLGLAQGGFDAITIEQKDKPALTVRKGKGGWLLPGYFNVPVAADKIDGFNRKLLALKAGWPVASTEDAAGRFQVSPDKFERKISFQKDGKPVKVLYLGSTPGFKKIHARMDGQKAIQVIEFSAFEAGVTPEDWMRQDLAKMDTASLTHIRAGDFSLAKTGKDWVLEGLQTGQTGNAAEIKAFVDKLPGLVYSGVLGVADKPEYHLDAPAWSLVLKKPSEETTYQFGKQDGSDDYVLKISNQPYYFKVSKTWVDDLKAANLQKLLAAKPDEAAPPVAAPAAPTAPGQGKDASAQTQPPASVAK